MNQFNSKEFPQTLKLSIEFNYPSIQIVNVFNKC